MTDLAVRSYTAVEIARLLGRPDPTGEQIRVIEAPLRPVLVIAGAGSGKTETMSSRVVWLVANGLVRPEEVLGLTFTRKAAAELSTRVRERLAALRRVLEGQTAVGDPTVSTYNAYAARVVAEHGLRSGFEPSARLLADARTWQLADSAVHAYEGDMSYVENAPPTVSAAVLDLAGQLAEHLRTPDEIVGWTERLIGTLVALPKGARQRNPIAADLMTMIDVAKARLQLLPLVEEYESRKRRDELMDFADQVSRAAVVARDHAEVGRSERARYRVVLLDEYQDTSHAQLVLLRALFGGGHAVTAVGDPCQSIYAWRGASAGNLIRFGEHFPVRAGVPAPTLPLTTSWRNAPRILVLANGLSAPLRSGSGQGISQTVLGAAVPELRPRPGADDSGDSGDVRCALLPTIEDEAVWIATRIAERWRAPSDVGPPRVAVLCRIRAQFERLASALRAAGLPVEVVGLGGLLATPEVRDLVATLTVLMDPTAGAALLRLLTGARWRLGPRDLDALGRRARHLVTALGGERDTDAPPEAIEELSIIEALDDLGAPEDYSDAGHARLVRLRDELRVLRSRAGQPIPDLVAEVEQRLGLDVEVNSRALLRPGGEDPRRTARPRAHLDAFAEVAAEFTEAAEQATLPAFLAYLGAADARERGLAPGKVDVTTGAVQVLTVHAAKGLEWDVVAVPGLIDKVFPSPSKIADTWVKGLGVIPFELRGDVADLPSLHLTGAGAPSDQDGAKAALKRFEAAWRIRGLADERRLAYVAVTRARTALLCSGAWWDTTGQPRGPSQFLLEIKEHCEDGAGAVEVWADKPLPGAENPLLAAGRNARWPFDPLGARRDEVEEAAALVVEAGRTAGEPPADELAAGEAWAEEARLLLAERDRAEGRSATGPVGVPLPSHLTVSQLVMLRADPHELARSLRRPVPRRPAPLARRGTAFHAWLERRFGADRLLDLDELPGASDADTVGDADLDALQAAFEASEWADRIPVHVEVPFATVVGGVVIRGRMDAVFRTAEGWEIVDWKTGARPAGAAATAAAVQLAAYRIAWAELSGVPVDAVSAAFHYVRPVQTVRPVDLLDAAGLAALVTSVPMV